MFGGSKKKQFYLESIQVREQTKRFAEGFLDERIDIQKITSLELHEIANEVNRLTNQMYGYIGEISRVLSHLSVGDLTVNSKGIGSRERLSGWSKELSLEFPFRSRA